jgi:hypothetical protein
VVLLRVQGLDADGQADLIQLVCVQCADALSGGAAVWQIEPTFACAAYR